MEKKVEKSSDKLGVQNRRKVLEFLLVLKEKPFSGDPTRRWKDQE